MALCHEDPFLFGVVFSRSTAVGQHLLYHSFSMCRALWRARRMHLTAVEWTQSHVHPTDSQPSHHNSPTARVRACCRRVGGQEGVSLWAQQAHADSALGVLWAWLPGPCYLPRVKISLSCCGLNRKRTVFQMRLHHVLFTPVPHWWMIPWKAIDSHYVQYRGKCHVFTQLHAAKCNEQHHEWQCNYQSPRKVYTGII